MDVIVTDSWNEYLQYIPYEMKDIYYTENYIKLYEKDMSKALCAVCTDEKNVLLLPFIRSRINEFYDFETAYGYGGPITNSNDYSWMIEALESINRYLSNDKYLCGFIRFNPLINNEKYCNEVMDVVFDRNTIAIDTEQNSDEIWNKQISPQNRNKIRKAEKNGLIYKAEFDFASMDEFVSLYRATMNRLGADRFYFFDDAYFQNFIYNLKGNSFLGTVRKGGKLICAALFIYSRCFGHYHLEGSDYNFSKLGANNFLLWKTACLMHDMGIKKFHLGGGDDSRIDNSLLKFKSSFNKDVSDFYIGKMIFNKEAYNNIKSEWIINNPDKAEKYANRLLCYRY